MPAPVKTALDALNAALGPAPEAEEIEATEEVEEIETSEVDEESAEVDETDEGEEKPDGEEDDGEEKPDGEEDDGEEKPDGEEDDGEEKPDADDEPEETPEAKAAREKQEAADKRTPPDHINDPIDPNLNKRTQERIRTLADAVKDLTPRAEQGDELLRYISESGMSADEFSMSLTYGKLVHSDDPEDTRKALNFIWTEAKNLAAKLGESLPGTNPLDGHADLAARVAAKTLTQDDALELARHRNRDKASKEASQRAAHTRTTAQQRAQATEALETECKATLNELGQQLSEMDPQFEAKMAVLQAERTRSPNNNTLKKIAMTPPQLRPNAFLKAFRAVKLPAKAAPKKTLQQPLRANRQPATSGGVRREPKSAVEAMNFALGLK